MIFFLFYFLTLIFMVRFFSKICKNVTTLNKHFYENRHYYDYNNMMADFDPNH
jgi:hypothetical protein